MALSLPPVKSRAAEHVSAFMGKMSVVDKGAKVIHQTLRLASIIERERTGSAPEGLGKGIRAIRCMRTGLSVAFTAQEVAESVQAFRDGNLADGAISAMAAVGDGYSIAQNVIDLGDIPVDRSTQQTMGQAGDAFSIGLLASVVGLTSFQLHKDLKEIKELEKTGDTAKLELKKFEAKQRILSITEKSCAIIALTLAFLMLASSSIAFPILLCLFLLISTGFALYKLYLSHFKAPKPVVI